MDTTPATTRGRKQFRRAAVCVVVVLLLVGLASRYGFAPQIGKVRATRATLAAIRGALASYYQEQGRYPDRLAELVPGFLSTDSPVKDSWRRDLVYTPAASAGTGFVLRSNGPDGLPGTNDDVD